MEMSITTLRNAITNEEDRLERYTIKLFECAPHEEKKVSDFQRLIDCHEERLKEYEQQMLEKMYALNKITGYQECRQS
jgi:hypothetical protein